MNPLDICSPSRWIELCESLGITDDGLIYNKLIKAHAERHRKYHTLDHIAACLQHLDAVKPQTEHPQQIEMALWFHDAIYQPFSATNEEDSAQWAVDWLAERGAVEPAIEHVKAHILATKSHSIPNDIDQSYMLDIDLSILGTSPNTYDQFEHDIRQEYKRVPKFIFNKERKAILVKFLTRPNIYITRHFRNALEQQARHNITRAISTL